MAQAQAVLVTRRAAETHGRWVLVAESGCWGAPGCESIGRERLEKEKERKQVSYTQETGHHSTAVLLTRQSGDLDTLDLKLAFVVDNVKLQRR